MATLTFTTKREGVLTDATSVVLSNAAGTAGIVRNDTGATVVAADTATINSSVGTYTYEFAAPVENIFYSVYYKVTVSYSTVFSKIVFYVSSTDATTIVPSAILAQYLISTLSLFTAVSDSSTWPLFQGFLPDSDAIENDAAAIFDVEPYTQGKSMSGALDQRYGVQFVIRSRTYDNGYKKARTLLDALQNKSQVSEVINGTTFVIENISSASGIVSLGTEKSSKQRFIFSIDTFVTIKEQ